MEERNENKMQRPQMEVLRFGNADVIAASIPGRTRAEADSNYIQFPINRSIAGSDSPTQKQ